MLAERQAEVYSQRRLADFLECFSSDIRVELLASGAAANGSATAVANAAPGKLLYPTPAAFRERYACVFARSDGRHPQAAGRALACSVTKRVYLEGAADPEASASASSSAPPASAPSTFCIDLMRIENLVRPLPPAFDGSAGTAFMASASVIVLYRARANKITHMCGSVTFLLKLRLQCV